MLVNPVEWHLIVLVGGFSLYGQLESYRGNLQTEIMVSLKSFFILITISLQSVGHILHKVILSNNSMLKIVYKERFSKNAEVYMRTKLFF